MDVIGAVLLRPPVLPKRFPEEVRCAVDAPRSARLLPDDERWKRGWFGLPGASDILEPDTERACFVVFGIG